MSDSVTVRVDVEVSPEAAFDVFVREIDAWYRVDPDTLPDVTRTAAIRFEPHLGGRLLDVHDLASGEGRELGRITGWEPGRRLVFVDTEGTEVEVTFERRGAGTSVTLTHRGLDRLAPTRAAQLRRSGWAAALAPFYRDHIAPNARPFALATGSLALYFALAFAALGAGAWLVSELVRDQPVSVRVSISILAGIVACAAVVGWWAGQDSLVRRWLPSHWQYLRMFALALGLAAVAQLVNGLRRVIAHGEDPLDALAGPVVLLILVWSFFQDGPAVQRNSRTRSGSPRALTTSIRSRFPRTHPRVRSAFSRHPNFALFCMLAGATVVGTVLAMIDHPLANLLLPAIVGLFAAKVLHTNLSKHRQKRREKQALGFDPDYYLTVQRRVSEGDRRPELLFHQPSEHPEHSGWYAYASERDVRSPDVVAWSMKELIDHTPEAAHPLREGHGNWRWDQTKHAYMPTEPPRDLEPA